MEMIERQAAIDAIGEIHSLDYNAQAIKARIEQLPSAQSEIPEWAQTVERWYNKALCFPHIKNPIAWALYQAWKEYDNERFNQHVAW